MNKKLRSLAFYLPQFYPTPYNDEWWGKGFTEWTNVSKATPRFPGHYQPHLPSDLGFYDLRLSETMREQAELAKQYLVDGFIFYHYWFTENRILEKPSQRLLAEKDIDMPFCLCWANQNWSRNWDGGFNKILLEQKYSFEDDRKHINYLLPYFADDRYIKVDGKPVFIIYRSELFPDIKRTTQLWREEAIKAGFKDLYLINIENITWDLDPTTIGFDAGLFFHPTGKNLPGRLLGDYNTRLKHKFNLEKSPYMRDFIWEYEDYARNNTRKNYSYKAYPSLFPQWDNTSRRQEGAWIMHNSSPEKYKMWLEETIKYFTPYSEEENFITINAWNEWAEGAHLEPCQKWGRGYLEAHRDVFKQYR